MSINKIGAKIDSPWNVSLVNHQFLILVVKQISSKFFVSLLKHKNFSQKCNFICRTFDKQAFLMLIFHTKMLCSLKILYFNYCTFSYCTSLQATICIRYYDKGGKAKKLFRIYKYIFMNTILKFPNKIV